MKTYSVIIIGAGCRGGMYADLMAQHPDKYRVVGVAEPIEGRREALRTRLNLDPALCFHSWEDVMARPKLADLLVIATPDDRHYEPAMQAIALGYDLLLEKPVAQTAAQCADIAKAAEQHGAKVLVCHVLRYTQFYKRVKTLLMEDAIGEVQSVIAVEAVGNVHQSHSYVRGNWHSEAESTPMLLAKCCHDLDILQWLLDKPCEKVQSFGSLTHFAAQNAPEGAPRRCVDGCPAADTCPYNAVKLYYDDKNNDWFRCACTKDIAKDNLPTDEEVLTALRTTDYGLCVYHANNDVVDHQVVNMEFAGGATVSFTMNAFNCGGRYIRLFGTKGELFGDAGGDTLTLFTFADRQYRHVPLTAADESIVSGHGGGDAGIVWELYEYLSDNYAGFCAADIDISARNHLIGFAAEEARHTGTVVDVTAYTTAHGL